MYAGYNLHHAAVSMAESAPVGSLHLCGVGTAILGDRNTVVAFDHAGHAGCPQYFVIQFAVDVTVGVIQKLQCIVKAIKRRSYKLH